MMGQGNNRNKICSKCLKKNKVCVCPNNSIKADTGFAHVFLKNNNLENSKSVLDYVPVRVDWSTGNFQAVDQTKYMQSLLKILGKDTPLTTEEINKTFAFKLVKDNDYPFEKFQSLSFSSVNNWMDLAFKDYLAARTLILHHQEMNSLQFCTSSVEKLFKYFIYTLNPTRKVNYQHKVHEMWQKEGSAFHGDLFNGITDVSTFLTFLQEAYTLRYHDGNKSNFNFFIISKKWLLINLDTLFYNFYVILQQSSKTDQHIDFIFKENTIIKQFNHKIENKTVKEVWSNQDDMITEVRIDGTEYRTISYTTDGNIFATDIYLANYIYVPSLECKKIFDPKYNGVGLFDK